MKPTPFDSQIVEQAIKELEINDLENTTIRQLVSLASKIEQKTGKKFIRMEMGVPGFSPSEYGIKAQVAALERGVASVYPNIEGEGDLNENASRFVKAFINVDIDPHCCVPTVGGMGGAFATFLTCSQLDKVKNKVLFIDPGFSSQKTQCKVLGIPHKNFDVYEYRGLKLRAKLEEELKAGDVACIVYSNPNNPAWICLKEQELEIIGELATKYDAVVIEDLAYLGMDFRRDLGQPFQAPYVPTVARYTDNYVLLLSCSKIFSYAGERLGMVCMSNKLYSKKYEALQARYGMAEFGRVLVFCVLYTLSSGVSHSGQLAMSAMFKAATDGQAKFVEQTREYGVRAGKLKKIFTDHGFKIVYDKDMDELVSDGFFFTITYPGMKTIDLMRELLNYGISAISLATTGSKQDGLRACTSTIRPEHYAELAERLAIFQENKINH